MDRLQNTIQPYAWGSRTALAELTGRPVPSPGPEAELWMGAHPAAPSRVVRAGRTTSLLDVIRASPERELGPERAKAFGGRLPFLLKVLAADAPLSLQAHPSLEQAREGFARENAAGIPLDAPNRNYRDDNHKPELLCTLTPFDALCGFRAPEGTLRLIALLDVPALSALAAPLQRMPGREGLARTFEALMTLERERRRALVDEVVAACRARLARDGEVPFRDELTLAVELGASYPGDPGVVGALLLNLLHLRPGEAIYLPAGNLHAYVRGVGVEIMASSDNVLRGGCTPKHVDVPELLKVLTFDSGPVRPVRVTTTPEGERVYETPAREFRLSTFELDGREVTPARRGAEILLCTDGALSIRSGAASLTLGRGESLFVSAADGPYALSGRGTLFRATAGG